jgi:hypothetical protein
MKIFIAGCGRSGTTLIRDLMGCFHDTYVLKEGEYGESPYSRFSDISPPASHFVIKRTGECWKTLPALPEDIKLIYCVRHPFDVLTSIHPLTKHIRRFHITYERWEAEYNAFITLRRSQPYRNIFILKYEEITHNPNFVQAKIADHFDLAMNYQFTDNPLGTRIFTDSVEKWIKEPDLFDYLKTLPHRFRPLINDFCKEFGYQLFVEYAEGYAETNLDLSLLYISNPNDLETLDGQPFFWLGDGPTILTIYSGYDRSIRVLFEAKLGPSFSGYSERHLRTTSQDWATISVVQPGPVELEIPVWKGENQVIFEVVERPNISVLPNGDQRPLMLGVLNLRVES